MATPRKDQTAPKAPTKPQSKAAEAQPEPQQQEAPHTPMAMSEGVLAVPETGPDSTPATGSESDAKSDLKPDLKSDSKPEPDPASKPSGPAPQAAEPRPEPEPVEAAPEAAPPKPAAAPRSGDSRPAPMPGDSRPAPKRSPFWPMLAGGVLSAAVGAAAVLYVFPEGWRPAVPVAEPNTALEEMTARLATLEADLAKARSDGATAAFVTSGLRDMTGRIDAMRQALTDEVSAAKAAGDGAAERLAELDARLGALEKRPVEGGAASATALAAFEREMQEMRGLLQESAAASSAVAGDIAAKAAQAEATIAAAEAEAARLRAEAEEAGRKAMGRAAIGQLYAAFDSGLPVEPALAALDAAGVEAPEGFREALSAAPSLQFLRDSFPDAARAALSATLRAGAEDAGTLERIGAFLRSQTGARSLEPRAGDDPDAILSRAEAALTTGDLTAALEELGSLPTEGAMAMAEWMSGAEARLTAGAALAELAATMN